MRKKSVLVLGVAAVTFWSMTVCERRVAAAAPDRIALRVFYGGHPGTSRESDFIAFLEKYFAKVGKGDLAEFKEEQAKDFDVVIMDYDGWGSKAPRPKLSTEYTRATVTVANVGGRINSSLRLKTGYL